MSDGDRYDVQVHDGKGGNGPFPSLEAAHDWAAARHPGRRYSVVKFSTEGGAGVSIGDFEPRGE